MANDNIEDTLVSVMLGAHRGSLLGGVNDRLPDALAILVAYGVRSPERVYFFRSQDFDNLKASGLYAPFLANLRHWQEFMRHNPPPSVKILQDCGLYSTEALYLLKPDEYVRLADHGIHTDTLDNLQRWQQDMLDYPAPFRAETWLELQLESGTIVPVTASPFRIGRDEHKEHIELHFGSRLVSRSQCWIGSTMVAGTVAVLTDTATNGTSVNGKRMIKGSKHLLEHGDKVGIGIDGDFTSNTFTVLDPSKTSEDVGTPIH